MAEDGTPKLLDFGIARLVSSELDETSLPHLPQTVTAMRMLTPDYGESQPCFIPQWDINRSLALWLADTTASC